MELALAIMCIMWVWAEYRGVQKWWRIQDLQNRLQAGTLQDYQRVVREGREAERREAPPYVGETDLPEVPGPLELNLPADADVRGREALRNLVG